MENLMTYDEFIADIKIRNEHHERIAKLFYPYFRCVSGDLHALSKVIGGLIGVDFSNTVMQTGCLNGIFDGSIPPFEDVDLYIRFKNDIRVFVYGAEIASKTIALKENEYILVVLSNTLSGRIEERDNRYIYLTR